MGKRVRMRGGLLLAPAPRASKQTPGAQWLRICPDCGRAHWEAVGEPVDSRMWGGQREGDIGAEPLVRRAAGELAAWVLRGKRVAGPGPVGLVSLGEGAGHRPRAPPPHSGRSPPLFQGLAPLLSPTPTTPLAT